MALLQGEVIRTLFDSEVIVIATGGGGIPVMRHSDRSLRGEEGEFPPGSMGPKMEAALGFLAAGGERVVVASTRNLREALDGRGGTQITA